jgi:uncharacterized protein (TIGR02271 family)
VIPVVEEELRVGKRDVHQGEVKVKSHVVETPFTEQVNLQQERVSVERRPVDRPLSGNERAFQDRTIEVEQRGEEAVVSKDARVKIKRWSSKKKTSNNGRKESQTLFAGLGLRSKTNGPDKKAPDHLGPHNARTQADQPPPMNWRGLFCFTAAGEHRFSRNSAHPSPSDKRFHEEQTTAHIRSRASDRRNVRGQLQAHPGHRRRCAPWATKSAPRLSPAAHLACSVNASV